MLAGALEFGLIVAAGKGCFSLPVALLMRMRRKEIAFSDDFRHHAFRCKKPPKRVFMFETWCNYIRFCFLRRAKKPSINGLQHAANAIRAPLSPIFESTGRWYFASRSVGESNLRDSRCCSRLFRQGHKTKGGCLKLGRRCPLNSLVLAQRASHFLRQVA